LKELRKVASDVCGTTFSKVETTYPAIGNRMQKNLCFSLSYIYTLLTFGLGFTISDLSDPWEVDSQIVFNNYVSGTKIDWALGAMIWEANQQPPSTIEKYLEATTRLNTKSIQAVGGDIAESTPYDLFEGLPDIKAAFPEAAL
jgi:hypothetical protein